MAMKRSSQANLKRLRAVMTKYDLKGDDVARRLGVTTPRVYGWLSVGQTTPIPATKLEFLELLLLSEARPQMLQVRHMMEPLKKKRVRRTKKKPRGGKSK